MRAAWERTAAFAMDGMMCGMMNVLQGRRGLVCSAGELAAYLDTCAPIAREEFYRVPYVPALREQDEWMIWDTPVPSGFARNDKTRVRISLCAEGPAAPTVVILHALMSASDAGYRKLTRWFNQRGWNAIFPHLPFHYSRTPEGYFNGELAITAHLIRNAETLRQGVIELRQLMAAFRKRGCREFALLGTSYGGWTGALLSFLEVDFRFVSLIQPIVNIESAIWENPSAAALRKLLRRAGITRGESLRHSHLSSPLHGEPRCGGERTIITAGTYDRVSPLRDLELLQERWTGSKLLRVRQGHFGYTALRETIKEIEPLL